MSYLHFAHPPKLKREKSLKMLKKPARLKKPKVFKLPGFKRTRRP